jgi:hypothetical protein
VNLAVLGVFLPFGVAMVAVSVWGWGSVPPGARFPIRFGGYTGFETTLSKKTALVLWPVLGGIVVVGAPQVSPTGTALLLGVPVMAILLLAQINSVRRASS